MCGTTAGYIPVRDLRIAGAVEEVRRNREIAGCGEPLSHLLDMTGDSECLLDDDDPPARWAGRGGHIQRHPRDHDGLAGLCVVAHSLSINRLRRP